MAPFSWNGSEFIYHRILKPFVAEHKEKIDEYLDKAKERASQFYDEGRIGRKWCSLFIISFMYSFHAACVCLFEVIFVKSFKSCPHSYASAMNSAGGDWLTARAVFLSPMVFPKLQNANSMYHFSVMAHLGIEPNLPHTEQALYHWAMDTVLDWYGKGLDQSEFLMLVSIVSLCSG